MDKVIVTGNVGRDPEMRYTPDGQAVATFSIATNRKYTNREGDEVKVTKWFNFSAWGDMANTVNTWVKKGQKLYVEGVLTADAETGGPRIWTGRDGNARSSFEAKVAYYEIMDWGKNAGNQEGPTKEDMLPEDDIPF